VINVNVIKLIGNSRQQQQHNNNNNNTTLMGRTTFWLLGAYKKRKITPRHSLI
jgi:hypothetical protein